MEKRLPYICCKYGYIPVTWTVHIIFWYVLLVASNHVPTPYMLNNCQMKREGGHGPHCVIRAVFLNLSSAGAYAIN
jgi:hypothetical protein